MDNNQSREHPGAYASDDEQDPEIELDLDEDGIPVSDPKIDYDQVDKAIAMAESARYANHQPSSSSGRPGTERRPSLMPSLQRVLSHDDGIDDSDIASQGKYQHTTNVKLKQLSTSVESIETKLTDLLTMKTGFQQIENRVAKMEALSEAFTKNIDGCTTSLAKTNEALDKLSLSHTKAYADLEENMARLEDTIKRAMALITASLETVDEEKPAPDKLVSVRKVLSDGLNPTTPTSSEAAASEPKKKVKKPSWLK